MIDRMLPLTTCGDLNRERRQARESSVRCFSEFRGQSITRVLQTLGFHLNLRGC